jgi:hypothetical protein
MDINKVQKLNEMASSLKRHNIGYDKDDALREAEKMYGKENDYSQEVPEHQENELDEMRKEVRKLSMAMQHMTQDMQGMKQKMEQLEKELNDARVGGMSRRQGQQTLSEDEPERPSGRPKPDATKPIDRNNVAPADVSVEKFFYYGK